MKVKKKGWLRFAVTTILGLFFIFPFMTSFQARGAFEYDELDPDNNLIIRSKYKEASATAGYKYSTGTWYFSLPKADKSFLNGAEQNLTAYDYRDAVAFEAASELISKTETNSEGVYETERKIDGNALLTWVINNEDYGYDYLHNNKPIVFYANRVLYAYEASSGDKEQSGPIYNYKDFINYPKKANWGVEWSSATKKAAISMYGQKVSIKLKSAPFSIEVVDANGNEPKEYKRKEFTEFPYPEVFFNELLPSISYPGEIASYKYKGYELVADFGGGVEVTLESGSSTGSPDYLLQFDLNGNNPGKEDFDLVLRFIYESDGVVPPKPATPTPKPTDSPNPTATPTPAPTSTPAPTPQPANSENVEENYEYYFTTDAGYNMDWVASNSSYYLATYEGGTKGGRLPSASATTRQNNYLKGTDSGGNTWYFIASGTNAIHVHPAVYKGNDVNTTAVRNITELTFPSAITYNGTSYTVTGIGGGTDSYRTVDIYSGSATTSYYNYGYNFGWYEYEYTTETSIVERAKVTNQEYLYGVVGNGHIKSYGLNEVDYLTSGGNETAEYIRNYYVYNTTLRKVVIPDTVTSIDSYAFMYCQALDEIVGGKGLTTIGNYAFCAGDPIYLVMSDSYTYLSGEDVYVVVDYYYYNNECSRTYYVYPNGTVHYSCSDDSAHDECTYGREAYTEIMKNCRERSVVTDVPMAFPDLPVLNNIGAYGFANRSNLSDVVLSPTVRRIGEDAFDHCKLYSITITSPTISVAGEEQSLGTGGTGNNRTIVYTVPGNPIINGYARVYKDYYVVKCGYKIYYQPNGPSDITYEQVSDAEFKVGDAVYMDGNLYFIERDGTVWHKTNRLGTMGSFDSVVFNCREFKYKTDPSTGNLYPEYVGEFFILKSKDGSYYRISNNDKMELIVAGSDYVGEVDIKISTSDGYDSSGNYTSTTISLAQLYYVTPGGELKFCDLDPNMYSNMSGYPAVSMAPQTVTFYDANDDYAIKALPASLVSVFERPGYKSGGVVVTGTGDRINRPAAYFSAVDAKGNVYNLHGNTMFNDTGVTLPSALLSTGAQYAYGDGNHAVAVDMQGDIWVMSSKVAWKETVANLGTVRISGNPRYSGTSKLLISNDTERYSVKFASSNRTAPTVTKETVTLEDSAALTGKIYGGSTNGTQTYIWTDKGYLYCNSALVSDVKFTKVIHVEDEDSSTYNKLYALDENGTVWYACSSPLKQQTSYGTVRDMCYYEKEGDLCFVRTNGTFCIDMGAYGIRTVSEISGAQMCNGKYVLGAEGYWYWTILEYPYVETPDYYLMDHGADYFATLYANPFTYNGYAFNGWNTKANGTGTAYQPGDLINLTADITLYAQWKQTDNVIRYEKNGGTGTMADDVYPISTTSAVLTKNKYSRDGYTFKGWNTKADGSGTAYADGATVSYFKGTLTLYAQWNKITSTYTLVYMKYPFGMTGNAAWKTKTLAYDAVETIEGQPYIPTGTTVTYVLNKPSGMSSIPAALSKTSDSTTAPAFDKWNLYLKNTSGTYEYAHERYSKGTQVSGLTEENGGTVYLYPTWGAAGSYVVLPYTEAEGYDFEGWSETANGTGTIYPVYPPEDDENIGVFTPVKNTTLYGIWTPLTKTVTLDATNKAAAAAGMSASVTNTQTQATFTYDATAPTVTAPTCSRWIFMGYYTKLDANGVPTADSIKVYDTSRKADGSTTTTVSGLVTTNNKNGTFDAVSTLYAYWVPDKYTIFLDARGATSMNHTKSIEIELNGMGEAIIVPEKTGYAFGGYFTGLRGTGTKYYDSDGNFVKPWTEVDYRTFYAYWIQNPVDLPEEEDRITPEPLPEKEWEEKIEGSVRKGLLYADDYNAETGALDDLQPYLVYDTPFAKGVIPGTELLSFRAKMSSWMLHFKLKRVSGTDMVRIYVTVPYRTQYEKSADEELIISEPMTATYSFMVPKVWSYWMVEKSGFYYPDSVVVKNEAIKAESVSVKIRQDTISEAQPEYKVVHYEGKEEHVRWSKTDTDGAPMLQITLQQEEYIISEVPDTEPEVDAYLSVVCYNAALNDEQQARVRSDVFFFAGKQILDDDWKDDGKGKEPVQGLIQEQMEVPVTSYQQTYLSGIALKENAPNGTYKTVSEIIYTGDEQNIGAEKEKRVVMEDINDITIHTPVVCHGNMEDGIKKEEGEWCLELKDALNFFTLSVSNYGIHRMSFGYGEKNFTNSISGKSNLAMENGNYLNQVCFPLDVYVDVGNDTVYPDGSWNTEGDYLLPAGIWITTGVEQQRFYLPVTAKNGEYVIEFRSIAVNCPKENGEYQIVENTEEHANLSENHYIATDTVNLTVKSYLKDFRITATNDFTAENQLKEGCQAVTLKKGYGFSYALFTQGEFFGENVEIKVTPSFYWESEDGLKRQEVNLYRAEDTLSDICRECYAWDTEPLLLKHDNYDVIRQTFSGSGMIPEDVLCVSKEVSSLFEEYVKVQTINGNEVFIKQTGYLIIQFEISVKSKENRWYTFDKWPETELAEDALSKKWHYYPGDVIRYDLSKSIREDYEVGGVE